MTRAIPMGMVIAGWLLLIPPIHPLLADYDADGATSAVKTPTVFRSVYRSVNLFEEVLNQKKDDMDRERDEYEDALRRYGPDNNNTASAKKRAETAEKEYRRVLQKADKASASMLSDLKK